MVQNSAKIESYMRSFDDDEVFILLELKHYGTHDLEYNYFLKGESKSILMSIAEIIEQEATRMGLSYDEIVAVMNNMHQINIGKYTGRAGKRIKNQYKHLE